MLRDGRVVATCLPAEESAKSLAEMMIGEVVVPERREAANLGGVRLQIDALTAPAAHQFGVALQDISVDVKSGEIVGIAGIAGNGQEELMDFLSGERSAASPDMIKLEGAAIGGDGPDERRQAGMCFAPEERLGHAAVPSMSLVENSLLSGRARMGLANSGFINWRSAAKFANDIVAAFNVRTSSIEHAVSTLSGGNLQKFVVGREITQNPSVFVVSQPTWGVDAGAAATIRSALLELARNGAAILIISQDLDELLEISDRIAVIANGRLSAAEGIGDVTVESIGLRMGGRSEELAAHA